MVSRIHPLLSTLIVFLFWGFPAWSQQDILTYGMKAQEAMNTGDYKGALPFLDRAITVDANNTWIRGMRASVFYHLGNYSKAREEYEFIVHLEPDNDTASSMITVLESMETVKKGNTSSARSPSSHSPVHLKQTSILTSPDGQVSGVSKDHGFQFSLPPGTWVFSERQTGTRYVLKCEKNRPYPIIVLQVSARKLSSPVLNEKDEVRIVTNFGNSLSHLTCRQVFKKRIIRGQRMYWGVFDAAVQGELRPVIIRYQWLAAVQGNRLYTLAYAHPKGTEDTHMKHVRSIFWNFLMSS